MTLLEQRVRCEEGLRPLVVIDQIQTEGNVLVVLKDEYERFHCHRYFPICDQWECSYDGQSVPLENVWSWLNHPAAWNAVHVKLPEPVTDEMVEAEAKKV